MDLEDTSLCCRQLPAIILVQFQSKKHVVHWDKKEMNEMTTSFGGVRTHNDTDTYS
jgi:hypothetical protein